MRKMLTCILLLILIGTVNTFAVVNTEIRNAFLYHGTTTGWIHFEIWAVETSSQQNFASTITRQTVSLNLPPVLFQVTRLSCHGRVDIRMEMNLVCMPQALDLMSTLQAFRLHAQPQEFTDPHHY